MAEVEQFTPAPLTRHGGRIETAKLLYPGPPGPWLDLSTGINPVPWAGSDLAAFDLRALPSVVRLADLEAAAGTSFGAATASIAALPGTEIGLRLLGALDLPAPIRYVAPTYRTYGETFASASPIAIDTLAVSALAGGTIILANPNNPDGYVVAPALLLEVARILKARGGVLVVDEAFADVDPSVSILPHLSADDAVLVFRSFGKFFGLAGLRLGFACGGLTLVEQIRARLGDWPVSTVAIVLGTAAYRDPAWIEAARLGIVASAAQLDAILSRAGLTPIGACPLFRLIDSDAAPTIFDRLARAGILVRPFDDRPRWLRFGLPPDQEASDRLARALASG